MSFVGHPAAIRRAAGGDRNWVPPLHLDARVALDPARHPFYEHSEAAFWLALRAGQAVGRLGVMNHRPHNEAHGARNASFTLFECEDDHDTATALFEQAFEWARRRGLTRTVGPRGLGALDGYGLLVDGFDRRQLMTMTGYNPRFTNAPGRYCRNTLIEEMQSLKPGRHGPETRSRSGTSAV